MVSTLEQMQVPNGTGPGVRRSKRPLLASRTHCNVLWKPPKFGNKFKSVLKSSSVISSKLKRSVDMTSSGKNGLNIRTNASPK